MRLGVIGINEGNGHPFSFAAIVNGFDEDGFRESGWPVIHAYLRAKDESDFGFPGVAVTHAWTQEPETTRRLCRASRIAQAVAAPEDMIGQVDAVLLARHDHENHLAMARPFLEAGLSVLVDKPLSVDPAALAWFRPYLEAGKLMSCSGLAFARELDPVRGDLAGYGRIKLVRGAVLLDWEKYGIHMVDAVLNLGHAKPVGVTTLPAGHMSVAIDMDDGSLVQIDALDAVAKTFRLDVFGSDRVSSHDLFDNFSAFRRLLHRFVRMVETGEPQIDPQLTLTAMCILIGARRSQAEGRRIPLSEVKI